MIMKNRCNIKYILLSVALCWGGSNVSNASVLSQGLTAFEKDSSVKTSSSENGVSEDYSFDENSWRNIFVDAQLQALIERGLKHNTDLNVARLRIDQAEASFKVSRLANLPSVAFSPTAGISSFDGGKAVKTYSLPLQASWQVDIFRRLKNAKMQQKMLMEGSKAYEQAVQVNLIANIARSYYQCALLDAQLSLANQSVSLWDETVRAMKVFMEEGQYTDAAVSQAEASRELVKTTALDLQQQMREMVNNIRVLVGDSTNSVSLTFDAIDLNGNRSQLQRASKPIETTFEANFKNDGRNYALFSNGINLDATQAIPLSKLSNRPDVRQAEMNLAASVYATKESKAAFYPSLTLSGSAGWTNSSGMIVNPGKMLVEAIASLTQPIFQNGRLKADLAIKKSQQEEARLQFQQALLNAGVEVNNALTAAQTYNDKSALLDNQAKSLERTVKSTRLLQQNGSSNYLEVLTAQENLLSAQMSRLENEYNKVATQIALYQAMP